MVQKELDRQHTNGNLIKLGVVSNPLERAIWQPRSIPSPNEMQYIVRELGFLGATDNAAEVKEASRPGTNLENMRSQVFAD